MPIIEWSDNLQMHIRAIDNDHKMLVDIINDLADSIADGKGREHLGDHLQALADYAEQHFRREEGFMAEAHYPNIGDHMHEHQALTQKIHGLIHINTVEPDEVDPDKVLVFLKEWLTNHILKSDMHYAPYLRGAKAGSMRSGQSMRAITVRVPPERIGLILQCAMAISESPVTAQAIAELLEEHKNRQA